jgi:hypothetical protein
MGDHPFPALFDGFLWSRYGTSLIWLHSHSGGCLFQWVVRQTDARTSIRYQKQNMKIIPMNSVLKLFLKYTVADSILAHHAFVRFQCYDVDLFKIKRKLPITVAVWCKPWTVFARSNAGIVGSNPTWYTDFVCVYSVCIVLCVGSGLATGWSPVQGVLSSV